MSTLHIITGRIGDEELSRVHGLLGKSDAVLLAGEGVYLTLIDERVQTLAQRCPLFALREDCASRGLSDKAEHLEQISYDRFVDLCCAHDNSVSWS